MGIYIKGMEMPTRCADCFMYQCGATSMDDCPLIPVPDHGDLIDRDALKGKTWDADTRCGYVQVVDIGDIDIAPTIIPADPAEEDAEE